jgi:hypothetical protein
MGDGLFIILLSKKESWLGDVKLFTGKSQRLRYEQLFLTLRTG